MLAKIKNAVDNAVWQGNDLGMSLTAIEIVEIKKTKEKVGECAVHKLSSSKSIKENVVRYKPLMPIPLLWVIIAIQIWLKR